MRTQAWTAVAVAALGVLAAGRAGGANVTWDWTNYVNLNWSTNSADTNWKGGRTYYQDGDACRFENHNKGARQVLAIQAGGIQPASIAMAYWGGENGSYEFAGGDITGTGSFSMTSDGVLHLGRSFSFSGGVNLSHTSCNVQLDPAAAGTYHFGTGTINLSNASQTGSQGQFRFLPTVAATCDNDFAVASSGGSIAGNQYAQWDSTVTLNGPVRLYGADAAASWSGMTFDVQTDGAQISMERGSSGDMRDFDGMVDGGGVRNVRFGDGTTSGSTTDYEIVLGGDGGWNVKDVILYSPSTAIVLPGTLSQTYFDGITGRVVVTDAVLATTAGSTGNYTSYGGTYYCENDYAVHADPQGRIIANTIYVRDGGRVAGDGRLHGHGGGVIVQDGTLSPGFSIGTLNITGDLTLGSDAVLDIEFGEDGVSCDIIAVDGDLTLDGTLNVNGGVLGSTYTFMTYTGSLTNPDFILDVTGLPPYVGRYAITAGDGQVTFMAIPEPATAAWLGLAGLALLRRRPSRPRR